MTPFQWVCTLFMFGYLTSCFRAVAAIEIWANSFKPKAAAKPKLRAVRPAGGLGYDRQQGHEWAINAQRARAAAHEKANRPPARTVASAEFVAALNRRNAGVGAPAILPPVEDSNETTTPPS